MSLNFSRAVFNRISDHLQELSVCNEENPDCSDIELIQHINIDVINLIKLLEETIQKYRLLKKSAHIVLINSIERAICNWMETYPNEFADIQKKPNEKLSKICCDLFDILDNTIDNKKCKTIIVWPLQIMLLILSPQIIEEIINAEFGAPLSQKNLKKKQFIDCIKKSLLTHGSSSNRHSNEAAAVTCVKLCKSSTYINNLDSNNVIFKLVQNIMSDLITLLFNQCKPFSRSQSTIIQDIDLMIDCFVSCFRIKPHNDDIIKICLNLNSPTIYQFVLISSLYKIITQPRLIWWPKIDILYTRSYELRNMFTDTLNKVTQNYISHTPLRMIQSLTMKGKEQSKYKERGGDDISSYKNLLLWMVKLIHTDPMLMLYNNGKTGHEIQSSTLELINGLVSLVHQPTMNDIANEAMEALLVLHHPDKIKSWNPESPIKTFWDFSSQVLFSISQKLIQHQIINYTDILKWLREILIQRNSFLLQNKDNANIGSQIPICKQAHIKLEVVFFMYLWSIDMEAVLVSLSCFSLLCEEADIRCGSDEVAVTCLLPNYQLYIELAQASTGLTTGKILFYLF